MDTPTASSSSSSSSSAKYMATVLIVLLVQAAIAAGLVANEAETDEQREVKGRQAEGFLQQIPTVQL